MSRRQDILDAIADIKSRITGIDFQLGARKPTGFLPDDEHREYIEWKRRAVFARLKLIEEKNRLQAELRRVPSASMDDVQMMSMAVIDALGLSGDDEACRSIYAAVRRVLDVWEEEDCGSNQEHQA